MEGEGELIIWVFYYYYFLHFIRGHGFFVFSKREINL